MSVLKKLDSLWERARYRHYYPQNWFKLRSLHKRYELDFLRYSDMQIMIPRGRVPDCENCLEICCTGPHSIVSLRLRDIAALIDAGLESHITQGGEGPVLTQDKTKTCTLLTKDRLCGAYPAWPISCARYPYAVDARNKVVFYAKGCRSHEQLSFHEANPRTRNLVQAAIDSYNERIKDILLMNFAQQELREIGLMTHIER